jgi:DNA-binding NarL/FixJ family response regulator
MEQRARSPLRVVIAVADASIRARIRGALDATTDLALVAAARDGSEAWGIAVTLSPDVLLLDERLPIMSGLEVLARLQSEMPSMQIVMYVDSPPTCIDAVELGAAGCIPKGWPLDALLSTIRAAGSAVPVSEG